MQVLFLQKCKPLIISKNIVLPSSSPQIPPIHPRLLRLLVLVAAADVVELAVFDELRAGLVEAEGVSSADTRGKSWCSRARGSSWREYHGTKSYS